MCGESFSRSYDNVPDGMFWKIPEPSGELQVAKLSGICLPCFLGILVLVIFI